jgi:hypothetical protein
VRRKSAVNRIWIRQYSPEGGKNEKNGIGLGGNMLLYLRRARRR